MTFRKTVMVDKVNSLSHIGKIHARFPLVIVSEKHRGSKNLIRGSCMTIWTTQEELKEHSLNCVATMSDIFPWENTLCCAVLVSPCLGEQPCSNSQRTGRVQRRLFEATPVEQGMLSPRKWMPWDFFPSKGKKDHQSYVKEKQNNCLPWKEKVNARHGKLSA